MVKLRTYATNYGTGQMVKFESGTSLFAAGKNTGNYIAGQVARLKTPLRVNYNYEDDLKYKDPNAQN